MDIVVVNATFTFRAKPPDFRHVAPITLGEWAPFDFGTNNTDHAGQDILLDCPLVYGELEGGRFADQTAYARSLEYFLENRSAIQQSVLAACHPPLLATLVSKLPNVRRPSARC